MSRTTTPSVESGTSAHRTFPFDDRPPDALISFCGEEYHLDPGSCFVVGREADLSVDDNPFLHRRFLSLAAHDGLWWIENIGSRIAATVADASGMMQAWVGPGARLPLVFESMTVVFSAGPTTYEFDIDISGSAYIRAGTGDAVSGETTVGEVRFTPSQYLLILALSEPWLLRVGSGPVDIPRSAEAAARLGWSITRFNRKLDNVAEKLDRLGVGGLRGGADSHARYRRVRLVEYAVAARMVTRGDLHLLDEEHARNHAGALGQVPLVRRRDGMS